ncbi:MAG: glycoside hydrolase family 3 N-terminal domain-containing protein [Bacteroidota bacterium]
MRELGLLLLICMGMMGPASSLVGQNASAPFSAPSEGWADSVMQSLNLRERMGQLFQVAAYSNREVSHKIEISRLVSEYHVGGLIFFQGGPMRQSTLSNHYQSLAKVPLMISMDAEWGIGMRLDSTISFPYQMALGAIQDNRLIYEMGQEIARQSHRLGMHVNFAPVVDVNNNAANPVINYRSFGEDKYRVTAKGTAYMKGMQDAGLLASAKHFPGHGDTGTDSHYDLPVIAHPRIRLDTLELFPFKNLINLGLGSTMVAHLSIPVLDSTRNQPSTLSRKIVTDLLKKELGFDGLVFTDAMNMKGLTKYYEAGEADVAAFLAGNDILLFPGDVPKAFEQFDKALADGRITEAQINDACYKVLKAKEWLQVGKYRFVDQKNLREEMSTPAAHLLNRKLTAASLTVLRNQDRCLPIRNVGNTRILSLSIGLGRDKGFTESLQRYAPTTAMEIGTEADATTIQKVRESMAEHDLVIVAMHQRQRRINNTLLMNDATVALVNEIAASGKGVVVLFRNPYLLNNFSQIHQAEALVVAYQSNVHSEDLAAQLLFGAIGANGQLPVTVNENFKLGDGLELKGKQRLGFDIPEAVGWDGAKLAQQIDSIALAGVEAKAYPGCQVLVAKKGKVIFHETYGFHTYAQKRAVQKDDVYDLASLTKVSGPLPALMQLTDQGKFDLDAPLKTYWPKFKRSNKADLSMRSILAHNARLQAWIPYWRSTVDEEGNFKKKTFQPDSSKKYPVRVSNDLYLHQKYRKKMYRAIKDSPLNDDPGYLYSGLSFYLYPQIIENLSGQDYESYCQENIYRRLGAFDLGWNAWKKYPLDRIVPTERDTFFRKEQLHGFVHDEGASMMGGVSGNAGLFGTAHDLAKLMQMYMNMGSYGGEQIISEQTMKEFTRYQYRSEGNRRGLGFDKPMLENPEKGYVAASASESSFGHSGYTGTMMWADPDEELVFIFLSNRVYPSRENRKLYELNIRPSLHQVLYEMD